MGKPNARVTSVRFEGFDLSVTVSMPADPERRRALCRLDAAYRDFDGDELLRLVGAIPPTGAASYDHRTNQLADECGRLKDENRALAAENSRLRRALERRR